MKLEHAFMAEHLIPYLNLARLMDDTLVAYLLGMAVEHCIRETHSQAKLSESVKRKFKAIELH